MKSFSLFSVINQGSHMNDFVMLLTTNLHFLLLNVYTYTVCFNFRFFYSSGKWLFEYLYLLQLFTFFKCFTNLYCFYEINTKKRKILTAKLQKYFKYLDNFGSSRSLLNLISVFNCFSRT